MDARSSQIGVMQAPVRAVGKSVVLKGKGTITLLYSQFNRQ